MNTVMVITVVLSKISVFICAPVALNFRTVGGSDGDGVMSHGATSGREGLN